MGSTAGADSDALHLTRHRVKKMPSKAGCLVFLMSLFASAAPAQVPGDTVPGHYVWGAEVNVFSPCGSDREYWVVADSRDIRESLIDQYSAFDLPPYAAVFVRVRGEFGPVLECEFCKAYAGSFRIVELLEMESPGPEECMTGVGGGAVDAGSGDGRRGAPYVDPGGRRAAAATRVAASVPVRSLR